MLITKRCVVVTGASSGIGLGTVRVLIQVLAVLTQRKSLLMDCCLMSSIKGLQGSCFPMVLITPVDAWIWRRKVSGLIGYVLRFINPHAFEVLHSTK